MLLRTGWSRRWPDRKAYLGDDTPGDASKLHFPSYGEEAAQLLVARPEGRRARRRHREHRLRRLARTSSSTGIANGADVFGLENLARLDELPERGAWVVALPMKIAGGSGGPLRIVALVP